MSMDDFMRSLSDQQKAMFLAALQDSGTPPEKEVTGDEDDSTWTTTMPPHIKEETASNDMDFTMNNVKQGKTPVRATGENGFTDTGSDCKSAEDATPEYTPMKRTRRPAQKVTVTCSACGRQEQVGKQYVMGDYYRCSRCVGR